MKEKIENKEKNFMEKEVLRRLMIVFIEHS
jgi:hypothetical protein